MQAKTSLRTLWLLPLALLTATAVRAQDSPAPIVHDRDVTGECAQLLKTLPQPTPQQIEPAPADCDSAALYFGIGVPVDYRAARACAFRERAAPSSTDSDIFAGPGVLSMIYANGQGVARNLNLARRFVCESSWAAPAELADRLDLLDKMAHEAQPEHFDLCDTATSGLSMGWCASIDTRQNDARREAEIHRLSATLTPAAQQALQTLRTAEQRFENLREANEIDLTGTGRAAFELQDQDKLRQQFLNDLQRFRTGQLTQPEPFAKADAQLNEAYTSLRANAAQAFQDTTITFAGVQKTQHAWLVLRDAWRAYAPLANPSISAEAVATQITRERTHQLRSLNQRQE